MLTEFEQTEEVAVSVRRLEGSNVWTITTFLQKQASDSLCDQEGSSA